MIQLQNINHSFDVEVDEVGVTIRKGTKWSVYNIGTEIELWNCSTFHKNNCSIRKGCKYEGKGKIIGYWVGLFDYLP